MWQRAWTGLGACLVLAPAIAFGLVATGAMPMQGSHGLGEWLFDSACFVLVLLGTLLSAVCWRRWPAHRRLPVLSMVVGVAVMLVFLGVYGVPFAA